MGSSILPPCQILWFYMHKISTQLVCVNGKHPSWSNLLYGDFLLTISFPCCPPRDIFSNNIFTTDFNLHFLQKIVDLKSDNQDTCVT